MPIFPTQYSTLSAIALSDYLQHRYSLKNTWCKLLIRNVSDTYVLESASSKYVFKVYRDAHRKIDEIKGEVELLTLLHEQGAEVSYPVADRDGQMLQQFEAAEGIRYGVLFTWAQGKVVYAMSSGQLNLLGKEMALIHNLTSTITLNYHRKPYTPDRTILNPLKTLKSAFAELIDDYNYLKTTSEAVIIRMDSYSPADFSYGYCHYDFLPKNFHFLEEEDITFFDFDFAGEGLLANDLFPYPLLFGSDLR
jgi:Ser/Thr protein kinase RdoA (MazF antagonist)